MKEQVKRVVKIPNLSFFASVKDILLPGNQVRFRVAGNSMFPFLCEGDEVLIKKAELQAIKIGDIVLAQWRQDYVLHRVIRFRRKGIMLAGDNNLVQIEEIRTDQLVAVLVEVYRGQQILCLNSIRNRWAGMVWHYLRPFRRIWTKIYTTLVR